MTNSSTESASARDEASSNPVGNGASTTSTVRRWEAIWFWAIGLVFAALTWGPLGFDATWGLHGGDIYTYFFPLKAWYADRLHRGELPLWNPMIGHGFPALGESQTGVFYPPNLVLYRWLPLNAAYNVNFLLHYVLAFGFSCHYARRLGLSVLEAILSAVVFVYGWFPARSCLEWAIITGAWIPLAFWGAERFVAERRRSALAAVQLALVMQLLAGHFNLAFVNLFGLSLYIPLRMVFQRYDWRSMARRLSEFAVVVALASGVAAIQLIPSWELKSRSQRATAGFGELQVGYGAVPWRYLAQTVMPWNYYAQMNDPSFEQREFGGANTNKVEAHLYFGVIPLALAVVVVAASIVRTIVGRSGAIDRSVWIWLILGTVNLTFAIGLWTRQAAHLPGFGYFTGPGRYGVLVQLGIGILAAAGARELCNWLSHHLGRHAAVAWMTGAIGSVACITVVEFWLAWAGGSESFFESIYPVRAGWCSVREFEAYVLGVWLAGAVIAALVRRPLALIVAAFAVATWIDTSFTAMFVQYAVVRRDSPIARRESSKVRRVLEGRSLPPRLLARNQNAISLCGVATVPVYLGIGPSEYFGGPLKIPDDYHWDPVITTQTLNWLRWAGVTHVLAFEAMNSESLELVWNGTDPLLHDVLGRAANQPLWLYSISGSRDRCYRIPAAGESYAIPTSETDSVAFEVVPQLHETANQIAIGVNCDYPSIVVLTELNYPGWSVTVDGRAAEPEKESVFRAVRVPAGSHEIVWRYRPTSLLIGLGITVGAAMAAGVYFLREVGKSGRERKNPAVR